MNIMERLMKAKDIFCVGIGEDVKEEKGGRQL